MPEYGGDVDWGEDITAYGSDSIAISEAPKADVVASGSDSIGISEASIGLNASGSDSIAISEQSAYALPGKPFTVGVSDSNAGLKDEVS